MVWYGTPEYAARIKTAGKKIALDYVLQELVLEVARLHASPIESLNDLQAKVHSRFRLESDPNSPEIHVQAEASAFADDFFQKARDALRQTDPGAAE